MTDPITKAMAAAAYAAPTATLAGVMHDVREFHLDFGHPAPNRPTLLTPERADARASWKEEEAQELRDATTIAEQADAAVDGIYFNLGTLVELGIDPTPIWAIVQAANMAKRHMVNGVPTAVYFPEGHPKAGKVMKPDDWQDPTPLIRAEVERQIAVANEPVYF